MACVFTFGNINKIKQTEESNWEAWAAKENNPGKETQVSERHKQCFESECKHIFSCTFCKAN